MRVIHLARKPLSEKSVAANVLKYGTGALNIDASRVGTATRTNSSGPRAARMGFIKGFVAGTPTVEHNYGRWPANLIFQHRTECRQVGTKRVKAASPKDHWKHETSGALGVALHGSTDSHAARTGGLNKHHSAGYADEDGKEAVATWECVEGCPVADLDEQSGDCPVSGAARTGRPAVGGAGTGIVQFGIEEGNGTLHNDRGGASRFFKQVGGSKG